MAGRRTNLALLIALAGALATGATAFALGTGWNRPVTVAHGVIGLAVVALAPWKVTISRRGLAHRSWRAASPSLLLAISVVVAVGAGLGHALGPGRDLGPVTGMQLHVGAALVAIPLALWHVVARPVRPRREDLSRRAVLRAGAVTGGAAATWMALEGAAGLMGLSGADRRGSGSYERGTDDPDRMPVTQWLDDSVPSIAVDDWRLTVRTGDGERALRYDELPPARDEVRATLDCTGGWWAEQTWRGLRLAELLDGENARSVIVRSATGYSRAFPWGERDSLLLALQVGGRPLSPGHGFPARLVAPGRRGFWWVKWVETIEVSDRPSWWQPPFPVT